ncbi:MAG: CopD family protein [Rhodocyclaceae bacterium]
MLYNTLLCLHILAAIVWVGGMVLMHFVVRPAIVGALEPPQRLPLMTRILGDFFAWVSWAVALMLATGVAMLHSLAAGGAKLPIHLHLMAGIGVLMALVFVWIRLHEFPALRAAVAASTWPVGGAVLLRIRRLVSLNLVLGVLTVVVATLGRALV